MYESVEVVGLSPSPGSFLGMDYYHRPPGLGPEKGLLPGAGSARPFGGSLLSGRTWTGSSHCESRTTFLQMGAEGTPRF